MNYFQILSCSSDLGNCCKDYALAYSLDALRKIMSLIQIIVPILLIVLATFQFIKLVANPEEKNGMKKVLNKFIAAVIVFFIPILTNVVLNIMPKSFNVSACWKDAKTIAETSRKTKNQHVSIYDDKRKPSYILSDDKYEKGKKKSGDDSTSTTPGSAKGILEGAEKVHTMYEQQKWAYYSYYSQLKWGDIKYSTNNPSKMTCCATFVGSALYVGGVFTEKEINKYNYNSQYGISQLCQAHNWKKITDYSKLVAGDIVIMTAPGSGSAPGHVQIYAGNGKWYNAGSTGAIQQANPYTSDASARFLYAWRKP